MICYVMICHVMSCHVMSCHVMSCHVMSCHVMLGYVRNMDEEDCDILYPAVLILREHSYEYTQDIRSYFSGQHYLE